MRKRTLLHIISTGKYERYIEDIISSSFSNFLIDTDLSIVLYTDSEKFLNAKSDRIFTFNIKHEDWPFPTLKRFHYFSLSLDIIKDFDYSFYIDVDSLFLRKIELSQFESGNTNFLVGTLHPGFYGTVGTPERRPESKAFIPHDVKNNYFCGGFFGGSSVEFQNLIETIKDNIDEDLSKGIIAIWHDESHLNRYFLDFRPEIIFGEGFCSPQEQLGESIFTNPIIVFLDKPKELKKDKKKFEKED